MASALELVKDVYSRFADGDIDGFLNLCAEDIEWVVNGPTHLAKCRAFKGRRGVQEFLHILTGSWEFRSFTPQKFIADGQTVVVLGEEAGKDKSSGIGFENRWTHVFDVQGGQIVRFREFLCHWSGAARPPAMSWSDL